MGPNRPPSTSTVVYYVLGTLKNIGSSSAAAAEACFLYRCHMYMYTH